MTKKIMLLALAVASAALFALPAFASAQEIHFDTATTFTGAGGAGSLAAKGEPTITCESSDVNNGTIGAGGTTGTMVLDFTGCHATVFGLTAKCHTKESPLDNTIASGGTFHLITYTVTTIVEGKEVIDKSPAVLVTANPTEIICASISNTYVEGNIIGTITSPACEAESNQMKLSFNATTNKETGVVTQDHELYTGLNYDLIARTGGKTGSPITAGLSAASTTLTANATGKLTCT